MVVRMRHTRAHTGNRRSHHALLNPGFIKNKETGKAEYKHRATLETATYRGKKVAYLEKALDKKLTKLNKKNKQDKK